MHRRLKLILASQSPRRLEILRTAGYRCTPRPSNSSELFSENLTIDQNLRRICRDKLNACLGKLSVRNRKGILILVADTVVVIGQRVLGKPKNRREAAMMLRALSGKKHCVKTAFTLFCPDESRGISRIVKTRVGFRNISADELQWYLDSGEPFDKAGSYAIQGLGQRFVNFLDGDLLNVVGLPLFAVEQELRKQRWSVKDQ